MRVRLGPLSWARFGAMRWVQDPTRVLRRVTRPGDAALPLLRDGRRHLGSHDQSRSSSPRPLRAWLVSCRVGGRQPGDQSASGRAVPGSLPPTLQRAVADREGCRSAAGLERVGSGSRRSRIEGVHQARRVRSGSSGPQPDAVHNPACVRRGSRVCGCVASAPRVGTVAGWIGRQARTRPDGGTRSTGSSSHAGGGAMRSSAQMLRNSARWTRC